ncbi:MAG: anti-sigma factor [Dongiaceae bacterium]
MTMGRPISEEDLQAYVDDALDGARRSEVEEYLERHLDVAGRIDGYARQRDTLRQAFAPIAEEPLPPELALSQLMAVRRTRFHFPWRAAAAAILFLGLGGIGGWAIRAATPPQQNGIAALAQEATDSYNVYASDHARPVEINAAGEADLVKWVSNRLQHPVVVPNLTDAGYRFMGGRLVATSHGPAGMFLYDDDQGTRLAVLVRPMSVDQDADMSESAEGPVAGFTWADQGIGYSMVSAAPAATLHPLANEVRRQIGGKI